MTSTDPGQRPTRGRFVVLGFLASLMFVLYIDRICMGQAVVSIQQELGLKNEQMSYALMAFTLAYGLFELPSGRWGDQIGARAVLTRIAIWWSIFTALTGTCYGLVSLVAIRFLFGAGEAGALPNSARIVSRWFPEHERGRVQGLLMAAAQLGGAVAPVMAAYLIRAVGWRGAFVIFGTLGVFWAVAFWLWFRDDPHSHPAVNEAERALIGRGAPSGHHDPIPWRAVFRCRTIWLLGAATTFTSAVTYFYFSWLPKYMESGRGVSAIHAGWLSSLVLVGGATGILLGGVLVDRIMTRSHHPARDRARMGALALLGGALGLIVAVRCESPTATSAVTALSCLVMLSAQSTWWSCAIQVSGRHIGALFGLMNGLGVFGAMSSQYFVGFFSDYRKDLGFEGRAQWDPLFDILAGVAFLGAVCWYFVDPSRPIQEDEPATRQASGTALAAGGRHGASRRWPARH